MTITVVFEMVFFNKDGEDLVYSKIKAIPAHHKFTCGEYISFNQAGAGLEDRFTGKIQAVAHTLDNRPFDYKVILKPAPGEKVEPTHLEKLNWERTTY